MADFGTTAYMSERIEKGDFLCNECWNEIQFEEVSWYAPYTTGNIPAFYLDIKEPAWVCPFCDAPLEGDNLKEFLRWKRK